MIKPKTSVRPQRVFLKWLFMALFSFCRQVLKAPSLDAARYACGSHFENLLDTSLKIAIKFNDRFGLYRNRAILYY